MCGRSACTVRRGEGPKPIGPSYPYRDTFRIGHFEPMFDIYDDKSQAMKTFR